MVNGCPTFIFMTDKLYSGIIVQSGYFCIAEKRIKVVSDMALIGFISVFTDFYFFVFKPLVGHFREGRNFLIRSIRSMFNLFQHFVKDSSSVFFCGPIR